MRRIRLHTTGERGFTLVEAMVVVGILAVLTALGLNSLGAVRERSAYTNASNDVLDALRRARSEAFGTSVPHVMVLDADAGRWWVTADVDGDFTLDAFDPDDPAPAPDRLLGEGVIEAPALLGPAKGWGEALPAPFQSVPAEAACTFCDGSGWGAVTFYQNGTARLTGDDPGKGSLSLTRAGMPGMQRVYAVLGRTGQVQHFDR